MKLYCEKGPSSPRPDWPESNTDSRYHRETVNERDCAYSTENKIVSPRGIPSRRCFSL
ncbi:hypothetical protein IF1G_03152 [Cordyceps javanica]|uniref:Uncharacterized protein n=1 Tax=Cordyceps javanica TaxID=43265 RepID=A0A545V6Q7_9HYPO|nr:hypothetical protein IF1G_03152 [Cordyceps javanica]